MLNITLEYWTIVHEFNFYNFSVFQVYINTKDISGFII